MPTQKPGKVRECGGSALPAARCTGSTRGSGKDRERRSGNTARRIRTRRETRRCRRRQARSERPLRPDHDKTAHSRDRKSTRLNSTPFPYTALFRSPVILPVESELVGKHVGAGEGRLVRNAPSAPTMIKQRTPVTAIKAVYQSCLPTQSQHHCQDCVHQAFQPGVLLENIKLRTRILQFYHPVSIFSFG